MTNEEKIAELLQYKEHLDKFDTSSEHVTGYNEWIVDALELLLRCERDRTKKPK